MYFRSVRVCVHVRVLVCVCKGEGCTVLKGEEMEGRRESEAVVLLLYPKTFRIYIHPCSILLSP